MSLSQAQSYNTSAGLRFGNDLTFSINQRIFNHLTLEANFSDGLFSDHKHLSILGKSHHPMISRRLNIYGGGGYFLQRENLISNDTPDNSFYDHGIAGVIGMEITIARFNISIDYMPKYHVSNQNNRHLSSDSALSIKYVLWQRKTKTKNFFQKMFKKKK